MIREDLERTVDDQQIQNSFKQENIKESTFKFVTTKAEKVGELSESDREILI